VNKFPIKIILEKDSEMIYFSQLDLQCILRRALRRSKLAVYCTQGFKPHIKISFFSALKLGQSGQIAVQLYFQKPTTLQMLKDQLRPQLPKGLKIVTSEEELKSI